jgi:hypothetical protein
MVTQTNSATTSRRTYPGTGGLLSIISGGISLIVVIYYWSFKGPFLAFGGLMLLLLLSSILAIFGGILAIKRKEWGFSLFGAIASTISFVGFLGIWATVLIVMSKKEFN